MRVLQTSHATVLQVKVPRSKLAHIYNYIYIGPYIYLFFSQRVSGQDEPNPAI